MWRTKSKDVLKGLGLLFFAYLCWRMVQLSWKYTDFQPLTGFLFAKQRAYRLDHWRIAFYAHVFSSIWVLLLGIPQLVPAFRQRWPQVHRNTGIVYGTTILFFSGPSGLLMAFYALGGLPTRISFTLLALLWMFSTGLGWYYARMGRMPQHRAWMIRSYALTLSAVTQRVYIGLSHGLLHLPNHRTTYLVVGWLSWTLNLLVAEWVIRRYVR